MAQQHDILVLVERHAKWLLKHGMLPSTIYVGRAEQERLGAALLKHFPELKIQPEQVEKLVNGGQMFGFKFCLVNAKTHLEITYSVPSSSMT